MEWEDYLPWIREQKLYEARPQCYVDTEWLRVAIRRLRDLSNRVTENDVAIFSFDGEILRIRALDILIAMPARGKAWDKQFSIKVKDFPTTRLKHGGIDVWKDILRIGNRAFPVIVECIPDTQSLL